MYAHSTAHRLAAKHGTALAKRKVGQRIRVARAKLQLADMHPRPILATAHAWVPVFFWERVYKFLVAQETVA